MLRSFAAALNSQTVRIAAAIIMTLVTIAFLGTASHRRPRVDRVSPADAPPPRQSLPVGRGPA